MKIELHFHTDHSSRCGKVNPVDSVAMYREQGYDAIVVTDHYNTINVDDRFPGTDMEKTRSWLKGYEQAKAAGDAQGVTVLFGLEARVPGSENDFLIFGAEPEFVLENPRLHELDIPRLHALCQKYNALMIQAHPNRPMCYPVRHEFIDGVEVSNGNPRQQNNNARTLAQAEADPRMIRISGSDFHQIPDLARGGIVTDRDVRTNADLLACLRSGEYELIPIDL